MMELLILTLSVLGILFLLALLAGRPSRPSRPYREPAVMVLRKVQSGHSPGLIAEGWEEERLGHLDYWSNGDDLYERQSNGDLKRIRTYSWQEFKEKNK
jgi:hypothetical protein